jgi:hypothetical protein
VLLAAIDPSGDGHEQHMQGVDIRRHARSYRASSRTGNRLRAGRVSDITGSLPASPRRGLPAAGRGDQRADALSSASRFSRSTLRLRAHLGARCRASARPSA